MTKAVKLFCLQSTNTKRALWDRFCIRNKDCPPCQEWVKESQFLHEVRRVFSVYIFFSFFSSRFHGAAPPNRRRISASQQTPCSVGGGGTIREKERLGRLAFPPFYREGRSGIWCRTESATNRCLNTFRTKKITAPARPPSGNARSVVTRNVTSACYWLERGGWVLRWEKKV